MAAAMPRPTRATTHGRYRPGSGTRTSSTPCATRRLRRIDLRTSGDNRRSLRHVEGPPPKPLDWLRADKRTRLRNAGSQALTSRTHSASERYRTRAVSTARKGLTRRQASSLAAWPEFQAWFNAAFRTVRMRFAVARRLRMPSALLSILRWLGFRPGLERARAGFAARPRCQSSIFFAVSLPTNVVPSAGRTCVSAARRV